MRPRTSRRLRAASLARRTRPPSGWSSTTAPPISTTEKLAALEPELPFLRVVHTPTNFTVDSGDRNAAGGPDRAFNFGLEQVGDWRSYSHLGKLDGDIELPPEYLETLLERFAAEPELGIAAGCVTELRDGEWWTMPTPPDDATPQARLYTRECFEAIGGMPPYLGADVITVTYAKLRGFRTRTFFDLPYRHLRPMGSNDGERRGRRREGRYQYIVHYRPLWVLLRALVVARRFRPYGTSGLWFLAGYVEAAVRRIPRVPDPEYRAFARAEQRRRMRGGVRKLLRLSPRAR